MEKQDPSVYDPEAQPAPVPQQLVQGDPMTFQYPPMMPEQPFYGNVPQYQAQQQLPQPVAFGGFGNPQVSYNPNSALQQPLLMPQAPPAYQVSVTTAASGHGFSHHG